MSLSGKKNIHVYPETDLFVLKKEHNACGVWTVYNMTQRVRRRGPSRSERLSDADVDAINIILTGGSCATPRSSVACWGGSRPSPGSWLSEETSAASGCRSLSLCRLNCKHKANRRQKESAMKKKTPFVCGRSVFLLPLLLRVEQTRSLCKWWVGEKKSLWLFGLVSDNVFTIRAFSTKTSYD